MNLDTVRIRHFAYLDAVARLGHFGDAADALDVSQPALSQGLARLEAAVGMPLFERSGRTKVLTPVGLELAALAALVVSATGRTESAVNARRTGSGGVLSVGLIDAVALYLKAEAIAAFRSAHPDVTLRITIAGSGDLLDALDRHTIDLAVVVAPAPGFATRPLTTEPLFVYGEPVDSLAAVDRWLLYPEASHTRSVIDRALAASGITPLVETESGNPSVLAQLARLGAGWTVLPAGIAEAGPTPLTRIGSALGERDIVVARRRTAPADELVDVFLNSIAG